VVFKDTLSIGMTCLQFSTPLGGDEVTLLQAGSEKNKLNLHPDTVNQKLVQVMERRIGRPSTYAPTVKVLCEATTMPLW